MKARRRLGRLAALGLAFGIGSLVGGCSGVDRDPLVEVEVADGYALSEVVSGFDGPTQIAHHPDGRLLVAELNGEESDGTGRILVVDLRADDSAQPDRPGEVLFDGLLKPTGVAVVDDEIWVMEERTLSRGPIDGGSLVTVLDELPFNGRSESTLTPTPDGRLLYATSGRLQGGTVQPDSGVLWEHDPVSGSSPLATGFKNAYGHTFGSNGQLWVTEVSDGRFDGEPAADELVAVVPGADHGWPACVGDRRPVLEYGGDPDQCQTGPPSQALFASGATPTSVAVAPWDPDQLVVALWLERRVVVVPTTAAGAPHEPIDVLNAASEEGFRPQHLLVDGDRLLVVDFDAGRILALTTA